MNPSKIIHKKLFNRYYFLLLEGRARIRDVPTFLRLDPRYCISLYVVAFRIDRGLQDKLRHEQDMDMLELDIYMATQLNRQASVDALNAAKEYEEVAAAKWNFKKLE